MINTNPEARIAHDANVSGVEEPFMPEQSDAATLARLEAALRDANIGTWFFDTAQDRVEADSNMARFFSVSEEETNGGPLTSYLRAIYPDDLERVTAAIAASVTQGVPYDIEFRLARPDGALFWIAARGNSSFDDEGKPVSMAGVVIDITAKRAAEETAAQARAQAQRERLLLDAVLDAIPAGILIAEPNGRLVRFNRAVEQIWGGTMPAEDVAEYAEYVGYWYDSGRRIQPEEWAMARALGGETCPGDVVGNRNVRWTRATRDSQLRRAGARRQRQHHRGRRSRGGHHGSGAR